MAKISSHSFAAVALGGVMTLSAFAACTNNASNDLGGRLTGSSGASGGASSSSGATGDGGSTSGPPAEEVAFRALEADFKKTCGGKCHEAALYTPTPPAFLAPPDAYKSIKAQGGAVVADYYSSTLLNHGAHAGPALGDTPDLEAKMIEWLKLEAIAIQGVKQPSTDAVAIKMGANDVDMGAAQISGLTGVHMLFNATVVGDILSLDTIKIHAPAGTDVHVYKPKFYKVLPAPNAKMQTEIADLADQFSNTDQTVPGGADTVLLPGSAFFTSDGWSPYDFNADKIRITVEKLEPGKVTVTQAPKTCKNVAMFTANVLPSMRGQGGFNLNCSNCHNNSGLANMNLNGADQKVVCDQVLVYLNGDDLAKSLLVTHVTAGGGHGGGNINDPAGFAKVLTDNKAAFF